MARPRKPTAVLELKGAFNKDPQRQREAEPVPTDDIGDPPDHFTVTHCKAWAEVVSIAPPGVLFNSDRLALELFVCLLVEFRGNPNGFHQAKLGRLESLCGKFGMTPSDRSKIIVKTGEPGQKGFAAL